MFERSSGLSEHRYFGRSEPTTSVVVQHTLQRVSSYSPSNTQYHSVYRSLIQFIRRPSSLYDLNVSLRPQLSLSQQYKIKKSQLLGSDSGKRWRLCGNSRRTARVRRGFDCFIYFVGLVGLDAKKKIQFGWLIKPSTVAAHSLASRDILAYGVECLLCVCDPQPGGWSLADRRALMVVAWWGTRRRLMATRW